MPQTILVADNNQFYRQVLGDFLRAEGHRVEVAADGVEALARIRAGGVDVVLLDLIMPRLDGARLCRLLKSRPEFSSLKVVILSGILADEIEGIETIRADAYVAKRPMDQLQEALRRVLRSLGRARRGPLLDGFEKMYRREVVQELLQERHAREVILNRLTEGIVQLGEDRRILWANRAFEACAGREGSDLLSVPIEDLFGEASSRVEALFESLGGGRGEISSAVIVHRGRSLRFRLHSLKENGTPPPTAEAPVRDPKAGPPQGRLAPDDLPEYVLLVEDVTDQVKAREERERLREEVARAERMSALGIFVAGAAHELNNPLTGVLGYAQLLSERDLPEEVRQSLGKIEAGASRCKEIVEGLLAFSRRGQQDRSRESLGGLIDEAVAACGAAASARGVTIRTEPFRAAPTVEVCAREIVGAIHRVLDNAVRAAADGGGRREVVVRARDEGGFAAVEIDDDGPGIAPEVVGRIFDPFFTTRDVGEGKGLGLSVAYGIVRSHGGAITAGRAPGGGARMTLRLPRAGGSAAPEPPKVQAPARAAAGGRRILLVDDEPVVLDLLAEVLGASHEVDTAANGREGLDKACRRPFDLIILDIKMPDMTGRQMYEALAERNPQLARRVVFTTGDVLKDDTRRFLEATGNPYLSKPFSIDALNAVVDQVLASPGPG